MRIAIASTLVAFSALVVALSAPAAGRQRAPTQPPVTLYRAAVVAPVEHAALEEAQCTCLTGLGLADWCGGWVAILGEFNLETLDFTPYAYGSALSTPDPAIADAYVACAAPGAGFLADPVTGQSVDDVIDLGYDPLAPVEGVRAACAAGYQTGALPLPMPPRALFY